ncbi:MAG: hypothetical protein V8T24_11050 [Roseburia hominis]
MVSENVARINTDPGKGSKEEEDAFDGVRINAESYVLERKEVDSPGIKLYHT